MRKTFLSLAGGLIISGVAFSSSVSAEETYQIEKGDYLNSLAEKFDTSVVEIMEDNDLENSMIIEGETLNIDNTRTIDVIAGDTLSQIGKDFGVEVEDIMEWNELDTDIIHIGQELDLEVPLDELEDFAEKVEARENGHAVKATNNTTENESNTSSQSNETTESSNQQESNDSSSESAENNTQPANTSNQSSNQSQQSSNQSSQQEGRSLTVEATAYTADCNGCSGVTATGIDLNNNPNMKVIAVDPNVIPLGSRVHVEGYGEAIAGDTGGAINGNIIDLHVPTKSEAYDWGRRTVEVTILD